MGKTPHRSAKIANMSKMCKFFAKLRLQNDFDISYNEYSIDSPKNQQIF